MGQMVVLFLVLGSITQHVAGKDFAVFLPEHVLLNCAPKVGQKKTGL